MGCDRKNIAIVIVGFPRDFRKTIPTFVDNVLKPNIDCNIDLYMVTYKKYFDSKIIDLIDPTYFTSLRYKLLNDEYLNYHKKDTNNPVLRRLNLFNAVGEDRVLCNNLLPQFVQMKCAALMIEDQLIHYDVIMKTRFDVLYEKEVRLNIFFNSDKFFMCDNSFAYRYPAHNGGKEKRTLKLTPYGSVNDSLIIASYENMIEFFNLLENNFIQTKILPYKKVRQKFKNTEYYIAYYITNILKKKMDYANIRCGLWRKEKERFESIKKRA